MMGRGLYLCVVAGFALAAAPLAAQQTAPGQLPAEDQTSRSVPPAPPPERSAQTPPPFPSFPYVEPKRRHHVEARAHSSRTHQRTNAKRAEHHASRHAAAKPRLSKREKKDQRYCASLNKRQLKKNSKCRKLLEQKRETAAPRALTKQERKDEKRCANLSLRQVLRDRRCRKVAERQLGAGHDSERSRKRDKHPAAASKHKAAHRKVEKQSEHRPAAKHRRR